MTEYLSDVFVYPMTKSSLLQPIAAEFIKRG